MYPLEQGRVAVLHVLDRLLEQGVASDEAYPFGEAALRPLHHPHLEGACVRDHAAILQVRPQGFQQLLGLRQAGVHDDELGALYCRPEVANGLFHRASLGGPGKDLAVAVRTDDLRVAKPCLPEG